MILLWSVRGLPPPCPWLRRAPPPADAAAGVRRPSRWFFYWWRLPRGGAGGADHLRALPGARGLNMRYDVPSPHETKKMAQNGQKWPKTAENGRKGTPKKGPQKKGPQKKDPKKKDPKKERGGAHPARYPRHARGGSGARPPAERLRSYSRGRRQAAWPAAAQRAHRPRTRSGRGRPRGAALGRRWVAMGWTWVGFGAALMGRRWGGNGREWGRL